MKRSGRGGETNKEIEINNNVVRREPRVWCHGSQVKKIYQGRYT